MTTRPSARQRTAGGAAVSTSEIAARVRRDYARRHEGASIPRRFIRGHLWLAFDEMSLYYVGKNDHYDEQPLNQAFPVHETGRGAVRTTRPDRDLALIDLASRVSPYTNIIDGEVEIERAPVAA